MLVDRKIGATAMAFSAIVLMLLGLYTGFLWAHIPPHFQSPASQKIFYLHVPSAWASYLAYCIIFCAALLHFFGKIERVQRYILSSAEAGIVFCAIAIATGSVWAKAEWGVYWLFEDAKLTTTLILFLAYIGIFIFPRDSDTNLCAYAIASFFAVPISFISSRIWFSVHPNVIASGESSMSYDIAISLIVTLAGMTLLFISFLLTSLKIKKIEEMVEKSVMS